MFLHPLLPRRRDYVFLLVLAGAPAVRAEDSLASDSPAKPPVLLSEIHYQPPASRAGEEFVELWNAGEKPADVSGWRFTKGVKFEFPKGSMIAPGGFAVVCRDVEAFRAAFGKGIPVAGAFTGRLDNSGEILRLEDGAARAVSDVDFAPSPPWPQAAAGGGASLSRVRLDGDVDDPSSWAALRPTPGAPSTAGETSRAASLYKVRHRPRSPRPGEAVEVTVQAARAGPDLQVALFYEAGDARGSVPMKAAPAEGSSAKNPRTVFTAQVPGSVSGRRSSTLVRYRFEARYGKNPPLRFPLSDAPAVAFAFFAIEPIETKLPVYHLLMQPGALRSLESRAFSNDLWPAVFVADGEVYEGVRVRHRGAWARTWGKKPLKVVFPRTHPFGKVRRINLNSGWRDPAFIRECLAYEVYGLAGAPTLKSRPVRVQMNGEFYGLSIEVEHPRKRTLRRLGIERASLWKASSGSNMADERPFGSLGEFQTHYSLEVGSEEDWRRLADFCRGLSEAEDPAAHLEAKLDIESYLNSIAASAFLQNWDAFNKNHFVAHDPATGRWHAIPWDLDRTLGDHWNWRFDVASLSLLLGTEQFPGPTGWNRLLDRFLSVPAFRRRFEEKLAALLRDVFTEEKLGRRIDELAASVAADIGEDRRRWGGEADFDEGIRQLKRVIAERRKFLLDELPGNEPEKPSNVAPEPGAEVLSGRGAPEPVRLESGPFRHPEPAVKHAKTRFQLRLDNRSYDTPVLDEVEGRGVLALSVPLGLLEPRRTYHWRIAHVGTHGKTSEFSAETSFQSGSFPFRAVRFDLSRLLNRDLVANPGDSSNDSVDDQGGTFVEDGFDGTRARSPLAQGFPSDRRVGIHQLADYSGPNALQLTPRERGPVRVEVPRGRYALLLFLVTGGGDSEMPLALEYADGDRAEAMVPCDDWYDDNPPDGALGDVRAGAAPILNKLDRIRGGIFKDRNEPALFEVRVVADPSRELTAVVLDPARATYSKGARTWFNLFAATGVQLSTP